MLKSVVYSNRVKIYWDFIKGYDESHVFEITCGDKKFSTNQFHYAFYDLSFDTAYTFSVKYKNADGELLQDLGEITVKTCKFKKAIDVTKPPYNAVGDGVTFNTKALQQAINDCKIDEFIYLPKGVYLTGGLDLKSNIEIYLDDEAVLQGSEKCVDYLPKVNSRFEGNNVVAYRSLLNAGVMDSKGGPNCENIIIYGGKILGGGANLRKDTINTEKVEIIKENGLENHPNPPGYYSSILPGRRRGRTICFSNVKNVIIADCETGNAPAWNLHFIYCEDIVTCDCKIVSHAISNGDGWDPDSSKNCTIFGVTFDTGDDCVAIKSGKNLEGYLIGRPCENITVFDCYAIDGYGIGIGSELSGGIKNVNIYNVHFLSRKGGSFLVKYTKKRGGVIENISLNHCTLTDVSIAYYTINDDGEPAPVYPKARKFYFNDIKLAGIQYFTKGNRALIRPAIVMQGYEGEHCIEDVEINDIKFIKRNFVPYQTMIIKNVKNLKLGNITYMED